MDVQTRKNDVYILRNSVAPDVAAALNNFLTSTLRNLQNSQQLTSYQQLDREVIIVAEPISNKLLISATPRWHGEIMRLIAELDAEQPQVVIQVLIAEIKLTGSEEFGVEIGLQRASQRSTPDRFEQEKVSFFHRVREGHLCRAAENSDRYVVIDASKALQDVQTAIRNALEDFYLKSQRKFN